MTYSHYVAAPDVEFTEAFRRETEKGLSTIGPSSIHNALEVDLPSGTVLWGSGVSSTALGLFQARVVDDGWGALEFGVQLESSDIAVPTLEVHIFDFDQSLKREIAAYGRTIRGVDARLYRVSPNVPDADKFTRFVCQLDDFHEPEPLHFIVRFRPDDLPIRAEGGVGLPRQALTPADWPAIHGDAQGAFLGPVYGRHDSNGAGDTGMVPAYHVDTVSHIYAWSLGAGKEVTAVYVDGELANENDWTPGYTTVNGKLFSVITFLTEQTGTVTVDALGLTTEPDGTGDLLTNRVDILKHIAANFLWNNWTSGPYYEDSTTPLGLASLASLAQLLDDIGDEGSFLLGGTEQIKGDVLLRGFLESLGPAAKAFWTNTGTLDFALIDHRPVPYQSEQIFWEEDMRGGPPALTWPIGNLTREVVTQYVFDEAAGQYRQTLTVSDLSVPQKISVQRSNPWGARWIV